MIDNIAECSKNARVIYLLYLSSLAYCAVTLFGVTDRQIVFNEGVRLPLVNVDVSLRGFFFLAPAIAILVFVRSGDRNTPGMGRIGGSCAL